MRVESPIYRGFRVARSVVEILITATPFVLLWGLCSRIPSCRLPEVLRDHPELRNIGRITLRDSLASVWLALWDERNQRLVSIEQARADQRGNAQ